MATPAAAPAAYRVGNGAGCVTGVGGVTGSKATTSPTVVSQSDLPGRGDVFIQTEIEATKALATVI